MEKGTYKFERTDPETILNFNKLTATWDIQWTYIHWLPRYPVVDNNKNTSDKIGRERNTKWFLQITWKLEYI